MKVSGRDVAEAILKKLDKKIPGNNLHPKLAIILAGDDPSSRIYVNNKIKAAKRIGIDAPLFEFSEKDSRACLEKIQNLNKDPEVNGIIVQYPVYDSWNFDEFENSIVPQKDVDGFLENSPYTGATALAIWEMLTAFAYIEGFRKTEDFLKGKKIVVIGRGKTAGGQAIKLLQDKGFLPQIVVKDTENPNQIIKSGDVVISATGVKNIVNKHNLKKGAYVVGVGMGKEMVDGKMQIYGDIKEDEVSQIAKLYCPTIGGIGPLTIVSLLKNVTESARRTQSSQT